MDIKDYVSEEIEVTPEMIAAGSKIVWESFSDVMPWGSPTAEGIVSSVFRAMWHARDASEAE